MLFLKDIKINKVVSEVIENISAQKHRAIGMKPTEAIKVENIDTVKGHTEMYSKESNNWQMKQYKSNDRVIIRNFLMVNKND